MRATTLIATTVGSTLAAAAGAMGTDPDSPWYQRLDKPPWQPPPAAFPAVWTPLYATIAVAAARGLNASADGHERRAYGRALTVNLALNAGWSRFAAVLTTELARRNARS